MTTRIEKVGQASLNGRESPNPRPATHNPQITHLPNGALRIVGITPPFPRYAEVKLQPDGSLLIQPFPDEIKPEKAAAILGISRRSLYDLLTDANCKGEPLIRSRRPSPHRVWVETASVFEHRARTRDPEFWDVTQHASRTTP